MNKLKVKTIDGKYFSNAIEGKLQEIIEFTKSRFENFRPKIRICLIGDNPNSVIYVNKKIQKAKNIGIDVELLHIDSNVLKKDLLDIINETNNNSNIHGLIVQLPLPQHLIADQTEILSRIDSSKDIDGLHPLNAGLLHYQHYTLPYTLDMIFDDSLENILNKFISLSNNIQRKILPIIPCTPLGCLFLIHQVKNNLLNTRSIVFGNSNLVGKPLSRLLTIAKSTVTTWNSNSIMDHKLISEADIIVSATGTKNNLLIPEQIKSGAVIIDVGINVVNNKILGDIDYKSFLNQECYITPVPGGVGPMTVISLMFNAFLVSIKDINKA